MNVYSDNHTETLTGVPKQITVSHNNLPLVYNLD